MDFARALDSTALSRIAYHAATQKLWVQFTSGRAYRYEAVPEDIAYGILQADSAGRYVNQNIVRDFDPQEIELDEFDERFARELNAGRKGFVMTFPGMRDTSFLTWRKAA